MGYVFQPMEYIFHVLKYMFHQPGQTFERCKKTFSVKAENNNTAVFTILLSGCTSYLRHRLTESRGILVRSRYKAPYQ